MRRFIHSPTTRMGILIGILMYTVYAVSLQSLLHFPLLAASLFIALFIPYYSKISSRIEEKLNFKYGLVTLGRMGRFFPQFFFNVGIFQFFVFFQIVEISQIHSLGNVLGISVWTTILSQGFQYLTIMFSNREIGTKNKNVTLALSANIILTAFAISGHPIIQLGFIVLGNLSAVLFFGIGLLSDVRRFFYPKSGIGIFFGTFNPIHNTHIEIIKSAIKERGLERVYLHATEVPKLHRDALRKNEIAVGFREFTMRVYQKTAAADPHVEYFPTGQRFFEYTTRVNFLKIAIEEAGLSSVVTVLDLPQTYRESGFYGIISFIKKLHPRSFLHGIHGTDLGGMWVRSIYDESGWIYPFTVKRVDKISATKIREGQQGMTVPEIEMALHALRDNLESFQVKNYNFKVLNNEVIYEKN